MPVGRVPPPIRGRLRVTITLYAPKALRNKSWDIFNREKLLCDFMTKQRVWIDDAQIDEGVIVRGASADPEGFVTIEIEEW